VRSREFIAARPRGAPLLLRNLLIRSLDPEIHRRCFPAVLFDLVLKNLPFVERAQAGTLHSRDMNKHVPPATAPQARIAGRLTFQPVGRFRSHR
jgi:hypothetical protein